MRQSHACPGHRTGCGRPWIPRARCCWQSTSVSAVQPAGQQSSFASEQSVIAIGTHLALQVSVAPSGWKRMQARGGGHVAGHELSMPLSQVSSGGSTTPSPHAGLQSGSSVWLPPALAGQQPSPARKLVISVNTHFA